MEERKKEHTKRYIKLTFIFLENLKAQGSELIVSTDGFLDLYGIEDSIVFGENLKNKSWTRCKDSAKLETCCKSFFPLYPTSHYLSENRQKRLKS